MNNYPNFEMKFNPYTNFKLGSSVGKNISQLIKKAENYVYVLSPYISSSTLSELKDAKKKNPHLDIKLIFSDKENFYSDENYQKLFSNLIYFYWVEDTERKKKDEEAIKLFDKKIKNIYFFNFIFLILFSFVYYFCRVKFNLPYPLYFVLFPLICFILFLFNPKIKIYKKSIRGLKIKKDYYTHEFKITPIDFKFIKRWHIPEKNKNDEKSKKIAEYIESFPYSHVKLFLMDFKSKQGKTINIAFWGSSNFTYSGLNKNIESLIETTDYNLVSSLKKFFFDVYNFNFPLHNMEEVGEEFFKGKILNKTYKDILDSIS